jgi:mobilome CxxCx(11)CxxC protein
MNNYNDLVSQKKRLREAKVRTYQTYLIFRNVRFAQRGLKLLTFLGIAVPLLAGGVVLTFYSEKRPPTWILITAGAIGLLQTLASLWSVVDGWDQKAHLSERAADEFTQLYIQLETFHPNSDGTYDEAKLREFESRSWEGVDSDNKLDVRDAERKLARERAEQRYPSERKV